MKTNERFLFVRAVALLVALGALAAGAVAQTIADVVDFDPDYGIGETERLSFDAGEVVYLEKGRGSSVVFYYPASTIATGNGRSMRPPQRGIVRSRSRSRSLRPTLKIRRCPRPARTIFSTRPGSRPPSTSWRSGPCTSSRTRSARGRR